MKGRCEKSDCTVAETGRCLLQGDPAGCPHFLPEPSEASSLEVPVAVVPAPPLAAGRKFHSGLELGVDDALAITQARYAHLIAVLGSWNAGKTCLLGSLYLMASNGGLKPHYTFAGSLTLQGFEDRVRRVRKWNGGILPDHLADHTSLSDPRKPCLLHLRLREIPCPARTFDLLLTDLPGEWTESLVNHAQTASRLGFLRRADGVILVIEGPLLDGPDSRHRETHRAKLLLERLRDTVALDLAIPFVILISKCDLLDLRRPEAVDCIERHAQGLGFTPHIVVAAAFSSKPDTVRNGTGVADAVAIILDAELPARRPAVAVLQTEGRSFLVSWQ